MLARTLLLTLSLLSVAALAGCTSDGEGESVDDATTDTRESMETDCEDGLADCQTVPGDDPHEGADRTYSGG